MGNQLVARSLFLSGETLRKKPCQPSARPEMICSRALPCPQRRTRQPAMRSPTFTVYYVAKKLPGGSRRPIPFLPFGFVAFHAHVIVTALFQISASFLF